MNIDDESNASKEAEAAAWQLQFYLPNNGGYERRDINGCIYAAYKLWEACANAALISAEDKLLLKPAQIVLVVWLPDQSVDHVYYAGQRVFEIT